MNDGLENILLKKRWNKHAVGATVRVDPVRAAWLRDNDFGDTAKVETKKKRSNR